MISGDGGNDRLNGQAGDDTVLGGLGDDRVSGGWGDDMLDGGAGNDQLYGGNWGRDGDSACDSHNCVPFGHSVDAVLEDHMRASGLPVRRSALRLTPGSSVSGKWGSFCWRDGNHEADRAR